MQVRYQVTNGSTTTRPSAKRVLHSLRTAEEKGTTATHAQEKWRRWGEEKPSSSPGPSERKREGRQDVGLHRGRRGGKSTSGPHSVWSLCSPWVSLHKGEVTGDFVTEAALGRQRHTPIPPHHHHHHQHHFTPLPPGYSLTGARSRDTQAALSPSTSHSSSHPQTTTTRVAFPLLPRAATPPSAVVYTRQHSSPSPFSH